MIVRAVCDRRCRVNDGAHLRTATHVRHVECRVSGVLGASSQNCFGGERAYVTVSIVAGGKPANLAQKRPMTHEEGAMHVTIQIFVQLNYAVAHWIGDIQDTLSFG